MCRLISDEWRNPVPFKENYPPPRTCHSLIGCSPSAELTSRGRQSTWSEEPPSAHAQIICLPLRTQLSAPSCNGECGRGSQHSRFLVISSFFKSSSGCLSFSMIFSFLAIFHVLKCVFLMFREFHFSRHNPVLHCAFLSFHVF